jgi:hypothetical protein
MLKFVVFMVMFVVGVWICRAEESDINMQLPPIGKWLEKKNGEPANWLGAKFKCKELIEPINIIIVDPYAQSREEAIAKLKKACALFGYKEKIGHSSGYCAVIDSIRINQFNGKKALSNRSFYRTNNHGRIMGPEYFDGKYIFVGAFSRESFRLFTKSHHAFRSFLIARNDFCQKLCKSPAYRLMGCYNLSNNINTPLITTGDHDGEAMLICANH